MNWPQRPLMPLSPTADAVRALEAARARLAHCGAHATHTYDCPACLQEAVGLPRVKLKAIAAAHVRVPEAAIELLPDVPPKRRRVALPESD